MNKIDFSYASKVEHNFAQRLIIKVIEGNFYNQHDVDILDDKRISIYNNNVFINAKNERVVNYSEIVIYNFETEIFSKKFEKAFTENITLKSSALKLGYVSEKDFDLWVKPDEMC